MNLSDFISLSIVTPVAILDNDTLMPIFSSAHPMRLSVLQEKEATKFAVEDGTDRSDHVVKKLTEISIDFLAIDDVRNAYQALLQTWEQNKLVTVQTRAGSHENMLILALPRDEMPHLGGAIGMPIRLQEWVEVKPETGDLPPKKVTNKNQSSTVKRGAVKGTESTKSSVFYEWFFK